MASSRPAVPPETIDQMVSAQQDRGGDAAAEAIKARIADASTKMDRLKPAIGAGADPAEVTAWINEARAQRIGAEAELRQLSTRTRMTRLQVRP
jgi:hypothetical protein